MGYLEYLKKSAQERKSILCFGLDPMLENIPEGTGGTTQERIVNFYAQITDAALARSPSISALKPNYAYFAQYGFEGLQALYALIKKYKGVVPIILDAKRGDIGSTSAMYAKSVFDYFNCDSVTLHPYMGYDSVQPFLVYKEKLNFVLTLTSNKSADNFETLTLSTNEKLYQKVIGKVNEWNEEFNNCGIVFGATQLTQLQENINLIKDLPLLLPGVGAQGGSLEDVVSLFNKHNFTNYLINASRSIIYASNGIDFAEKASQELKKLNTEIALLSSAK